jgi:hypothetical protein
MSWFTRFGIPRSSLKNAILTIDLHMAVTRAHGRFLGNLTHSEADCPSSSSKSDSSIDMSYGDLIDVITTCP